MRSGSSMTGSLFNSHPDVFYWYEPMHSLGARHKRINSDMDLWTSKYQFSTSDEATGNVTALLSCDIQHVYWEGLMDNFMSWGAGTAAFKDCFKKASRDLVIKGSRSQWDRCVGNLTAACLRDYRVVAMKTIRFRMSRALELMKNDPNLKVLHLVRDPRGILESRRMIGYANFSNLEAEAANLCKDIAEDLNIFQSLKKEEQVLKNRYLLARYEDIARSPVLAIKFLFHFIGMEPSEAVMKFVQKVSRSAPGTRKLCLTCKAVKSNSTTRSLAWRKVVRLQDVRVISEQCAQVMRQLGYRVSFWDEEELLDQRVSAVGEPRLNVGTSIIQELDEQELS
ncbi:carbohydrate sulfotransferase 6-like isoform X2 [Babylonia areolata]